MTLRSSAPRRVAVLAFVIFSAQLSIGCSSVPNNSSTTSSATDVLRIGSPEDIDNLNPVLSTQQVVNDVCQLVYSGLIDYDDRGEPVPDVALMVPTRSNGGISADGRAITYHLRHGVRFSDGAQLTSSDVAFTWSAIMNPRNDVPYRYPYDDVAAVATPDAYTVEVRLKRPLGTFVAAFMRYGTVGSIVPKHSLAGQADLNHADFNMHPVGSGPFVIDSWRPGEALSLRANPHYWRGPPHLRAIEYKIVPSEPTLLTMTRAHDIDFYLDANAAQFAALKGVSGFTIRTTTTWTREQIVFNT